ncbi:cartilage matrix protein-like [Channa argus]|uniref:cartilage matrix protein-like n=1 Tax=Channa argus TaxID=215402 RepID=UPI00351FCD8D
MDHLLMVLVLLWSSVLQAEGDHISAGHQCETTDKIDIVLLVDSSGSISPEDFHDIKSFVADLVNTFDIGPDRVQIGLTQFSTRPRTEWNLNTHTTKESLLEAIDRVQQIGGDTKTGRALEYILRKNFNPRVGMRADSHKIAVLITDGSSMDKVSRPSQSLKDAGIEIYTIGVGRADESQLMVIASDPIEVHMLFVRDFTLLQTFLSNFNIKPFKDKIGRQCETTDKIDIVLLLDDSGSISPEDFHYIKSFVANLVKTFDIGPDRVQIALTQFSTRPRTEWNLNTHTTKESLLEAIDRVQQIGGDTKTARALKHVLHKNFKPNVGMRAHSQKIAVLITDGESTDAAVLAPQDLKDTGIEVYTIGVGDANKDELELIASDPKEIHVYYVTDFRLPLRLIQSFISNLCRSTNSLDSVRLVNGTSLCSGRLEVKSNQSWSLVCEADFDQPDAEVVCRELGCEAPSIHQGELYREVDTPMWTREFDCRGNESALLECRSPDSARTCSAGKAVGLTCSEPVILVGDTSRCAGRLEVKHMGKWRPVDGSDWTLKEAAVACRELDCGSAVSTRSRNESSVRSVWVISSDCVHAGYVLRECASSGSSSSTLEITCSDLLFQPGISVSSMDGLQQQRYASVLRGFYFTISCTTQPQYPGGSFQLTYTSSNTTHKYFLPAVNHSADFLFPAAEPAHQGNYTCVYNVYVFSHNFSSESRLLSLTVSDPTVFIIRVVMLLLSLLSFITAICYTHQTIRGQKPDSKQNAQVAL